MERRVGAILREARKRRRIELSEVEEATRIRLRYLQAIEAEDWDVLPGGVYNRGFIRTYASFLGLDGERLAAEYRESVEGAPSAGRDAAPRPPALPPRGPAAGWAWATVVGVVAVAAIAIVALPDGGDGDEGPPRGVLGRPAVTGAPAPPKPAASTVSVTLVAGGEVWVCLLDDGGRPLVGGQILETGAEAGPFRSGSFTVSFGNGEVSMLVDGKEAKIPATASPIGYSIDAEGDLTRLSETERPTCT
ncbi:MAG TPA: helix-turn-helix domain-containing protein [Solirubrobacterales bacterium]|nr:helix-turn-helix domain-containing protein [Solirubrobacterales bacterium]